MKVLKRYMIPIGLVMIAASVGCSRPSDKSPDVRDAIHRSLDQSGFKDVSVDQDRDKGVVTLGGHVASDNDKLQAESIAKSIAGGQVISNQIAVLPPGAESTAKTVNSDLDKGIGDNLHAALVQNGLDRRVKYDVKNGVVTLTGDVSTRAVRARAESIATNVPNVQQVVNELQVKVEKATSSR